jgi:hypothetical protein
MRDGKTFSDLMSEIISSKTKLISTLVFILGIIVILSGAIVIGISLVTKKADAIEIKESGAMIISLGNRTRTASYLLSSNGNNAQTPWIDTNIEVKKGDRITFYVSGKICTAMHHIMEAAIKDTILPAIPWTGPEGLTCTNNIKEQKRKRFRLSSRYNQGQVIGIISTTTPDLRPDYKDIINVNTNEPYTVEKDGHLWLTINEVFLDDEILNTKTYQDLYMSKTEYDFIKKNHYANVWYDDNSGFFSVNMEIK